MTRATFLTQDDIFVGFEISGHSLHADFGKDIVCAAISSMTMLVVNTITEVYKQQATVKVDHKATAVSLSLSTPSEPSSGLLRGFFTELMALQADYPESVSVSVVERSQSNKQ